MMIVLTLHNFPEGLAVAVSTVENPQMGLIICFAIAIHNIPEGIAIAVPFFDAQGDRCKAIQVASCFFAKSKAKHFVENR